MFALCLGVVFVLLPHIVILLITTDPEVTETAGPILRIARATQIFYASGIVLAHALQAAGATFYVMMIEVLTHWIVFLPLGYLLALTFGGGLLGAWLALPVYIVSYTVLIALKYRKDSWLQLRVCHVVADTTLPEHPVM